MLKKLKIDNPRLTIVLLNSLIIFDLLKLFNLMNRLFFLAFILLCGCTSLNKVESTSESNSKSNEYAYSDSDSKIRYNITNDKNNLHIRLNTAEISSITKIIRNGLKINFDLNGKKGERFYFQYPTALSQQYAPRNLAKLENGNIQRPESGNIQRQENGSSPRQSNDNTQRQRPGVGQSGRFDLNKLFAQLPEEAIFNRYGEIEQINIYSETSDIKVTLKAINNEEMTYDLYIPLKRLSKDGIAGLGNLSVGIISGNIETSNTGGGRPESMQGGRGGMSGGSRSGMSGGGRGGMAGGGRGGMSGGGRGGMEGGDRSGGYDRSAMTKQIKFWFKLSLIN